MFKFLNEFKKNEKGYLSIEVIIISGLFISLGTFLIFNYVTSSHEISQKPLEQTTKMTNCMHRTGDPVCENIIE